MSSSVKLRCSILLAPSDQPLSLLCSLFYHQYLTFSPLLVYLKAENLQPGGSFKIRGATYALSLLNEEQRSAGVIAYSTGNHAQAVALASKQLGIRATIVMSPDAPD